jgi:predicted nucleic acid-binding protein
MKLLLDTCVLSEMQKPNCAPPVAPFFDGMPDSLLHISVITVGEITKGIFLLPDCPRKRILERWSATLTSLYGDRILPLDQSAAELWGRLTASGQSRGLTIPAADGLIAATALRHGLQVASRNVSHFEAAGAMVINPWLGAASVAH